MSKSHASDSDTVALLTPALWELLRACLEIPNYDGQKLADRLCISIRTVYSRTQRINAVLGTNSLAAAVALLVREGKLTSSNGENHAAVEG